MVTNYHVRFEKSRRNFIKWGLSLKLPDRGTLHMENLFMQANDLYNPSAQELISGIDEDVSIEYLVNMGKRCESSSADSLKSAQPS